MKVNVIEIQWNGYKNYETEALYNIASSRARGIEAVVFYVLADKDASAFRNGSQRLFKKLKKQGMIQTFLLDDKLISQTTESAYFLNKYPELPDTVCSLSNYAVVKL